MKKPVTISIPLDDGTTLNLLPAEAKDVLAALMELFPPPPTVSYSGQYAGQRLVVPPAEPVPPTEPEAQP